MGTITVNAAGFAALPVAAPANWPVGVTWPGNGTIAPNGSRSATLTDAEMIQVITWTVAAQMPHGTVAAPTTPTVAQILVTWVGTWWGGTKAAVQQYFTGAPTVPPAVNLN